MKIPMSLPVIEIAGGQVADDGSALRMITVAADGSEIVLSIPYEQTLTLLALAVLGRTEGKRKRGIDPVTDCDLIATKMFEIGFDKGTGIPVLIMTLANDGKISFTLPGSMPGQMHETLGAILGCIPRSAKSTH